MEVLKQAPSWLLMLDSLLCFIAGHRFAKNGDYARMYEIYLKGK
jgi:hypothetical protein